MLFFERLKCVERLVSNIGYVTVVNMVHLNTNNSVSDLSIAKRTPCKENFFLLS